MRFKLSFLILALSACVSQNKEPTPDHSSSLISSTIHPDSLPDLTLEQQNAFDAFNMLQQRTEGQLYSTFIGSVYPCEQPDSIFNISRNELYEAIHKLLLNDNVEIPTEERKKLISEAILAQETYTVEQCFGSSGTWVLRNVLDRRDIILEW